MSGINVLPEKLEIVFVPTWAKSHPGAQAAIASGLQVVST